MAVQTKELQSGAVFIFGKSFFLAVISGTGNKSKRGPSAAAARRNSRLQFAFSDLE